MSTTRLDFLQLSQDYQLIEKALLYLDGEFKRQPTLEEVANSVGYSPHYFQRVFTRWVGISPKRFLQYITKQHAMRMLDDSRRVLETAFQSGLSGPGRLHDLFVTCEAVTPGQYKTKGLDLIIEYGFYPTPFGECLVASTDKGICHLAFVETGKRLNSIQDLTRSWSNAKLIEKPGALTEQMESLYGYEIPEKGPAVRLHLYGTNFQIKVWEALLKIPPGCLLSYNDIGEAVGSPHASRAVGGALARNPVALIIPCHRVIQSMGSFGGYRWGTARKKAMLGWEMART
jgi:AraC family transcriptional regulator of adaptative response/methylated-DNA-[protein]-cysteine methyltransferase